MTFTKTEPKQKMHRVLIDDMRKSDDAFQWCKEFLEPDEWSNEIFDNFDCFYFTDKTMCSIFILVNGGRYIAPPRGWNE